MKTQLIHSFSPALLGLAAFAAFSASALGDAVSSIADGRLAIRNNNLDLALTKFTEAHAADGANQEASVLLALTRLAKLLDKTEAQAVLTKMGYPKVGRNILNWTAKRKGKVPGALNSDDFEKAGVAVLLPELDAIETLLAQATSPTFTLAISTDETGQPAAIADKGDVLFFRSLLRELKSALLMAEAFESKVALSDIVVWRKRNLLTIQNLLKKYPKALDVVKRQNLDPGLAAYSQAVALYVQASTFIRARADSTERVFVIDPEYAADEAKYFHDLQVVEQSLRATVDFDLIGTDTKVNAGAYAGTNGAAAVSLRTLLPAFKGNRPAPSATFPDLTFHGVLPNMTLARVEHFFENLGSFLDHRFHYRADPVDPTVQVTSPKTTRIVITDPNGVATVNFAGKAKDNLGVARVVVRIDNTSAVATGTTSWSYQAQLTAGSYDVTVVSFDAQGNASKPAKLKLEVIQKFNVEILATDGGTTNPKPQPALVVTGFTTTIITAKPKPGFLFDHWEIESSFTSNQDYSPTLYLYTDSPTQVEAIFSANPFAGTKASINGLLTGGVAATNLPLNGFYSVDLSNSGVVTGRLMFLGKSVSFKTQLSAAGFGEVIVPFGRTKLRVTLNYIFSDDVNGFPASLDVFVFALDQSLIGSGSSTVGAASGLTPRTVAKLDGVTFTAGNPRAPGYFAMSADATGTVRAVGELADGTAVSFGAVVGEDGTLPVYARAKKGGSEIFGTLSMASEGNGGDVTGTVSWIHPADSKAPAFKTAFAADLNVTSRVWNPVDQTDVPPPFAIGPDNASFAAFTYNGTGAEVPLTSSLVTIGAGGKLTSTTPAGFKFTLDRNSGVVKGSFKAPGSSAGRAYSGVLFPDTGFVGFFQDAKGNGGVRIEP